MPCCSFVYCSNRSDRNVTTRRLFRFPRCPRRLQQWVMLCRRDQYWTPTVNSRLCEFHFDESQFEANRQDGRRLLRPDAIPTIFQAGPSVEAHFSRKRVRETETYFTDHSYTAKRLLIRTNDHCYTNKRQQCSSNEHCYNSTMPLPLMVELRVEDSGEVICKYFDNDSPQNMVITPELPPPEVLDLDAEDDISPPSPICQLDMPPSPNTAVMVDPPANTGGEFESQLLSHLHQMERENKALQTENQKLKDKVQEELDRNATLEEEKRSLRRRLYLLERQVTQFNRLRKRLHFLNPDQVNMLCGRKQVSHWSEASIRHALQIKYACGKKGYEFLRKMKYPLPSYSTLAGRTNQVSFVPGIIQSTLEIMKLKASSMSDQDKQCCILVDEMQLTEGLSYDLGMKRMMGFVTLGSNASGESNPASHLLAVCLRGLGPGKWRRIIGWHLTDVSSSGADTWVFVREVIQSYEAAGFRVHAVTVGLTKKCRSVWTAAGIPPNVMSTESSVIHPCDMARQLYFMADPLCVLKSLRVALLKDGAVIPGSVAHAEGLPTVEVCPKYIMQVTGKDTDSDLLKSMKSVSASTMFSSRTANAIRSAVNSGTLEPDALATAYFVGLVARWYSTLNGKGRKEFLTVNNIVEKETFLARFVELVRDCRIGSSDWLPCQTGFTVSTFSSVLLAKQLLREGGLQRVLTSRLGQDAVRSMFSSIRAKAGDRPNALQVWAALKV